MATRSLDLAENGCLDDMSHGHVGAIQDGHLLQLLALTVDQHAVLDCLGGMEWQVCVKSWLRRATSEGASFSLELGEAFVLVVGHVSNCKVGLLSDILQIIKIG